MRKIVLSLVLLFIASFTFGFDLIDGEYYIYSYEDFRNYATIYGDNNNYISGERVVVIANDIVLGTDLTVPAHVTMRFIQGNKINVNNWRLTTFGGIDAGLYQIFDYSEGGTIEGNPNVDIVYPQWYGAIVDDEKCDSLAINYAMGTGNRTVLFPSGKYDIYKTIEIPSNTKLDFLGGAKIMAKGYLSPLECMMTPAVNAENIVIENAYLDTRGILAVSGLFFRQGSKNITVNGITVKNAKHNPEIRLDSEGNPHVVGGGRAISIHGGGINSNIRISNFYISNCYEAIDIGSSKYYKIKAINYNVSISNGVVEDCEFLVGLFGPELNSQDFARPHSQSIVISNINARNVGKSKTYSRAHGIINSRNGGNLILSNVSIYNEPDYLDKQVYLLMGKMTNVRINNISIYGNIDYFYRNSVWDQKDSNDFNGKISSDIFVNNCHIIGSCKSPIYSHNGFESLKNSIFEFSARTFLDPTILPSYMELYKTVFYDLTETSLPRKYDGLAQDFAGVSW